MNITVLYGTESGNSELVAEDLGDELRANHDDVEVADLQHYSPSSITPDRFYIIICSTHGEGDPPNTAIPFLKAFDEEQPYLSGVHYAMFGLGDSFYENYSKGSEHIDTRFSAQGATRVGEYGRHDASSWTLASDDALEWLPGVLDSVATPSA